jgi:hypothetical protein
MAGQHNGRGAEDVPVARDMDGPPDPEPLVREYQKHDPGGQRGRKQDGGGECPHRAEIHVRGIGHPAAKPFQPDRYFGVQHAEHYQRHGRQ